MGLGPFRDNEWKACAENYRMNIDLKALSSRQVGGSHYVRKTVQPWDAMESWMTAEAFEGYLSGNVIKYLARYKDKNGTEDLKKAQHYLAKLIEFTTKEQ